MDLHPATEVMVVNPSAIKNYAGARLQRVKTDPVDAQLILDFLQPRDFVPWKPTLDEVLQLQAITRRMNPLNVGVTSQAHRLHADGYLPSPTGLIEGDIPVYIRHLPSRIRRLEEKGIAMVLSGPELSGK